MKFPLTETLELRFSSTGLSVHELREDGRWHTKVKFGLFISFRQTWPQSESEKDLETMLADAQADSNKWCDHATEQKLRADAALTELARVRTALEWYLADDHRSVEMGILERLEDRPAFAALTKPTTPPEGRQ